ncbi:Thiol-disulfide isomerase or thioredoxin [Chitinophaga jiangningensis]|uniref:Thiol-disulfide isomerase or thioredoxin n=1 Tax=Chitinophaga jiangningensis TaxID=1419482 RepID=A0A1M6VMY1_9BACT|nr:TlpA disulfide reductase family protein [Chitinophaga jiangningensis]SHK82809.1 Thiol-disulfide isomerase or thioredoxin [Chitinophaga jiangningensis]
MKKLIVLLLLMTTVVSNSFGQQSVVISPAYPERGQTVTVTFDPTVVGNGIPSDAKEVTLVFSYSNFYNLPWRMKMEKAGSKWTTSFVLADYTVFATFYLESGAHINKPAKDQHYEVAVYKNKVPVENVFLYKGYSMSAQMGKSPLLAGRQQELYEKELALYPDNYEAKLRLLTSKMNATSSPEQKAALRKEAHQVIADRFNADPGNSGNLNKVTMGYLIIGENSRLDSIRKVVMQRYPESAPGRSLNAAAIAKGKDTTAQIAWYEKELQKETAENTASFTEMHEQLFRYYAARKNASKALYHARFLTSEKENPYKVTVWEEIGRTLQQQQLAPDSAYGYVKRALDSVQHYPVGVIRYFPETGYIYPYVDDSTRQAAYNKAACRLHALLGLIALQQNRPDAAEKHMALAVQEIADKETLDDAATYYQQTGNKKQLAMLDQFRKKILMEKILKQQVSKPAPALTSFVDMKGKAVSPDALKGKIIVIDFWATWCIPCMQEMPYLQQLYDQHKNNADIVFMITNSGAKNTLADAQGWSGNKKYSFPVYYNTDPEIGDKFKFNIIPASYLIDKKGNIRFVNIGFEGPEVLAKLQGQLDILLQEK